MALCVKSFPLRVCKVLDPDSACLLLAIEVFIEFNCMQLAWVEESVAAWDLHGKVTLDWGLRISKNKIKLPG
jgi:hypothetical protein